MADLLPCPCPFCEYERPAGRKRMECPRCGALAPAIERATREESLAIWNRRPIESSLRSRLAEAEAERDSQRDPTSLYESGYKRGFELGKRLSWERFMPKIDSALAEAEDERIECSRRAERAEARVVEIEAERAETEAKLAAVERRNGELESAMLRIRKEAATIDDALTIIDPFDLSATARRNLKH